MAVNTKARNDTTAQSVAQIANQSFDQTYQVNVVESLVYNPTTSSLDRMVQPAPGLVSSAYDYLSKTEGATSNTFVFKTGGAGGTTVATLVVDYTDSTKATLLSVTKS